MIINVLLKIIFKKFYEFIKAKFCLGYNLIGLPFKISLSAPSPKYQRNDTTISPNVFIMHISVQSGNIGTI